MAERHPRQMNERAKDEKNRIRRVLMIFLRFHRCVFSCFFDIIKESSSENRAQWHRIFDSFHIDDDAPNGRPRVAISRCWGEDNAIYYVVTNDNRWTDFLSTQSIRSLALASLRLLMVSLWTMLTLTILRKIACFDYLSLLETGNCLRKQKTTQFAVKNLWLTVARIWNPIFRSKSMACIFYEFLNEKCIFRSWIFRDNSHGAHTREFH